MLFYLVARTASGSCFFFANFSLTVPKPRIQSPTRLYARGRTPLRRVPLKRRVFTHLSKAKHRLGNKKFTKRGHHTQHTRTQQTRTEFQTMGGHSFRVHVVRQCRARKLLAPRTQNCKCRNYIPVSPLLAASVSRSHLSSRSISDQKPKQTGGCEHSAVVAPSPH